MAENKRGRIGGGWPKIKGSKVCKTLLGTGQYLFGTQAGTIDRGAEKKKEEKKGLKRNFQKITYTQAMRNVAPPLLFAVAMSSFY